MTIRKFSETPISVTQLIKWNTLSAEIGAYLWLCLEYGLNVFVCGETASGKTTFLNAIIPFVPPSKKTNTQNKVVYNKTRYIIHIISSLNSNI